MQDSPARDFLRRYREAIFALVMLVLFALVIYFTKDIKLLVVNTTVDARFWPKVCAVAGIVLSAILCVQSVIEGRALARREAEGLSERPDPVPLLAGERVRPLVTLLLMALYIAGLERFGFLVMTFLYLLCQFLLLSDSRNRQALRLVIIDAAFTAAVYLLFRYVFQMILPAGTIWG